MWVTVKSFRVDLKTLFTNILYKLVYFIVNKLEKDGQRGGGGEEIKIYLFGEEKKRSTEQAITMDLHVNVSLSISI